MLLHIWYSVYVCTTYWPLPFTISWTCLIGNGLLMSYNILNSLYCRTEPWRHGSLVQYFTRSPIRVHIISHCSTAYGDYVFHNRIFIHTHLFHTISPSQLHSQLSPDSPILKATHHIATCQTELFTLWTSTQCLSLPDVRTYLQQDALSYSITPSPVWPLTNYNTQLIHPCGHRQMITHTSNTHTKLLRYPQISVRSLTNHSAWLGLRDMCIPLRYYY